MKNRPNPKGNSPSKFFAVIRIGLCFSVLSLAIILLLLNPISSWNIRIRKQAWKLIRKLSRIKVELKGNINSERPLVLLSNHSSFWEIISYGAVFNAVFVGKSDLKSMPLIGLAMKRAGCFFIDRNPQKSKLEIEKLEHFLKKSTLPVVIFPEGTTNNGNEILKFKSSLFSITTAPIQILSFICMANNSLKSTESEREFYAYYIKKNPEEEESFFQHLIKVFSAGAFKVIVEVKPTVNPDQFNGDRKRLSNHCETIMRSCFEEMTR